MMSPVELSAISHELQFWKSFVQTSRFIEGWVRDIPTPELRSQVHLFIKQHLPKDGQVLDVGSGVVSILNGTVQKNQLIAADPLGDMYKLIFDYQKYGIDPPVAIPCELLPYENAFDIVHCSNALDHTQNPYFAFEKLLKATKRGGYLIIQCFENEAEYESWQGFHQHNLLIADDKIQVKGKTEEYRLDGGFKVVSVERILVLDFKYAKTWFIWICQKV